MILSPDRFTVGVQSAGPRARLPGLRSRLPGPKANSMTFLCFRFHICKLEITKEPAGIRYLLLWNKLPPNLVAYNNKHLLPQFLWVRYSGAA